MNARFYVGAIGRFASADTIVPDAANPQDFNRYTYGSNNPVKFNDPTGHYVVDTDDGSIDPDVIIESYNQAAITNPTVIDTPLILPIVVDKKIIGREFWMPANSPQSTISETSTRAEIGRFLASLGIVSDAVEFILAPFGGGVLPGFVDPILTYASDAFSGDNYSPLWGANPPENLPLMWASFNQDIVVNGIEAFIPAVGGFIGGVTGLGVGAATPAPGDEIVYGGAGYIFGSSIDALTSFASLVYDLGRFNGDFQNPYTIGFAPDYGLIVIHWS